MLSIRHFTKYSYEPKADRAGLRLKLFPSATSAQKVENWKVTVNGSEVVPLLTNPSGDEEALWFSHTAIEEIDVLAEGVVTMTDTAGVLGKFGVARPAVFLRHTDLTQPDDAIKSLSKEAEGEGGLAQMHALNELIHDRVSYRKGATDSSTTAAQALAQGAGVCQDLTHVFVSAARARDLPARYVTGYLHQVEEPELLTHAWAEVFLDGLGWTGFDPTHNECPSINHIRLCSGFDAADAGPLRGHITGEIEETLDVEVEIAQSQSQQ